MREPAGRDGSITHFIRTCSQVPLPGRATALPMSTESIGEFLNEDTRATIEVIRETDELAKARLAWIMGRRGTISESEEFLVQLGNQFGQEFFGNTSVGYGPAGRNTYWDNGKGVNRSSRLCSTEYLSRLYSVAMRRVCIQLSYRYDTNEMGGHPTEFNPATTSGPGKKVGFFPHYSGGLLGTVTKPMKQEGECSTKMVVPAANSPDNHLQRATGALAGGALQPFPYLRAEHPMQTPLARSASMTLTNNITYDTASRDMTAAGAARTPSNDSNAVRSVDNRRIAGGFAVHQDPDRDFKCGIYPRPISPFLHGRTLLQGVSSTLLMSEKGYPRRMPDALGDHVAFAALEQAMTRVGLLDWRPDGVVNSKLENGPDLQADAHYDAKDGQLFNVHVQGPAICSNWSGTEHGRNLVAGDKLFVAIVADCWVECGDKGMVDGTQVSQPVANKYAHLPAEMQKIYNTQSSNGMHNPVVGGPDLDAAAAKRAEILKSFQKTARGPGTNPVNSATELYYSKLFGLKEMRVPRANNAPLGVYDYHDRVSPHLLCNFRLKYYTSSQMIETSQLQLNGEGGVALGANGAWLEGSRCGLAFSRTQIRNDKTNPANGSMYDEAIDVWLDPENSVEAASVRQAGTAAQKLAAGQNCATAMNAYLENKKTAITMLTAHAAAADDPARTAAIAAAAPVISNANARLIIAHRQDFRGPNSGAALHEVITGAWHVGTVLDTAASRGAGRGFASHKNDSAVNVNVDVQWWSGDRLFKHYANKPGTGQEFKMRSMPVIGYTTNHGLENNTMPPVFDVKQGVGPSGGSYATPNSFAYFAYEHYVDQNTPTIGGVATRSSNNSFPVVGGVDLTPAQVEGEAGKVMAARTTFPDPWDLPAAVPMLTRRAEDGLYNLARDEYLAVGQQRGVWLGVNNPRRGRTQDATLATTSGLRTPTGRQVVTDPGNKFSNEGHNHMAASGFENANPDTRDQGSIVSFT
jgi:hypothetical protein